MDEIECCKGDGGGAAAVVAGCLGGRAEENSNRAVEKARFIMGVNREPKIIILHLILRVNEPHFGLLKLATWQRARWPDLIPVPSSLLQWHLFQPAIPYHIDDLAGLRGFGDICKVKRSVKSRLVRQAC